MTREQASNILDDYDVNFDGHTAEEIAEAFDMAFKALEQELKREFEDYENEIEDLHNRLDIAEYDKERLREEVTNLEAKIKSLEQEPCDDAISRQAAIDAVKKNTFRLTFAEEQGREGHVAWSAEAVYSDVMEGALLELPSANPQEPCDVFDEYGNYKYPSDVELTEPNTATSMPSEDVISRKEVLNQIFYSTDNNGDVVLGSVLRRRIENLPSVKHEPKTGHWIRWYEQKENDWGTEHIPHCKCSECGKEYDPHSSQFIKFCNECGAKMQEVEE